jgi:hypothetical protein
MDAVVRKSLKNDSLRTVQEAEKMTVEIEVMMDVILEFINPLSPMGFEHAFGDQSDCISDVKANAAEISNAWVPSIVFDKRVTIILDVLVIIW